MSKTRISGEKQFALPTRYDITAGIDTDRDYLVVAVIDHRTAETTTTHEFEQSQTGVAGLVSFLKERHVQYVVIESTGAYHMKAYEAMRTSNMNVGVINPQFIRALLRVEGKSDAADAVTLARLASSFSLRVSNMPDAMQQHIRLVTRSIDMVSNELVRVGNRTLSLLTSHGFTLYRCIGLRSVSGLRILQAVTLGTPPKEAVETYWLGAKKRLPELLDNVVTLPDYLLPFLSERWANINRLTLRRDELLEHTLDLIRLYELEDQIERMCTAPAVTPTVALRIIGEHGVNFHERYHSPSAFAAAIGVAPRNIITGGRLVSKGTGQGNRYVKKALTMAVKAYILRAPETDALRQWYDSYRARGGTYIKGVAALSRRIAQGLWWMEHKKQPYRPRLKMRQLPHNSAKGAQKATNKVQSTS